ncbi:MAG: IS701 family transposase, partial [Terracidiphilus sp.]
GLGHFEGRGWRGFHHHATLSIAAYGFLVAERSRFSPSARAAHLELPIPALPENFQPRGSHSSAAAKPMLHCHPAHSAGPFPAQAALPMSVLWCS